MNALLVARRDLESYLQGYFAYIILAALLFMNGVGFYALGIDDSSFSHEVLERFFYLCWGFTVATAVLLTMRSLGQEYEQGTDVLLRGSTVTDAEVVVGKWLAALGMVFIYLVLTFHMPLLIMVNGKVSVGHLFVGYLGVLLGGGAAAAMGVFFSALVRNQIAAGILAGVTAIFMSVFSFRVADRFDPPLSDIMDYIAIFGRHFVQFQEGTLSLSATVFNLSLAAMFLALASYVLNTRRWE